MLAPPPCGACLRSPRRHPRARVAIAESGLPLIVLLTGFEQFNRGLYTSAAAEVADRLDVRVFTDRDIGGERLESALADADVFFASLVFDYDQVVWLTPRVERIPTRLIFESALELMSSTRVGTFTMAGGGPAGPPKPIKALLSRFSSGREEDRLAGYISFLKIGPSLLKLVPGEKARDVRHWLEGYALWNQGGAVNVANMFRLLGSRLKIADETSEVVGEGLLGRVSSAFSRAVTEISTPSLKRKLHDLMTD